MGCTQSAPSDAGADAAAKAAKANAAAGGAPGGDASSHPAAVAPGRVPATTAAAVKKIAFANRGKVAHARAVADEDLPHGESINRYIAAAREELAGAGGRCVWDYYAMHDKLLGRGGFARVFRTRCLATGDPVAVKVISAENEGAYEMQESGESGVFRWSRAYFGRLGLLSLLQNICRSKNAPGPKRNPTPPPPPPAHQTKPKPQPRQPS